MRPFSLGSINHIYRLKLTLKIGRTSKSSQSHGADPLHHRHENRHLRQHPQRPYPAHHHPRRQPVSLQNQCRVQRNRLVFSYTNVPLKVSSLFFPPLYNKPELELVTSATPFSLLRLSIPKEHSKNTTTFTTSRFITATLLQISQIQKFTHSYDDKRQEDKHFNTNRLGRREESDVTAPHLGKLYIGVSAWAFFWECHLLGWGDEMDFEFINLMHGQGNRYPP
jgi:hypothetical protein